MATQALANRDSSENRLTAFRSQLERRGDEFKMALPSHITPEKFQRTVLTAVTTNPKLLDADRQSLILACYKAAQDGLLPDGREAALVEFKTRVKNAQGKWEDKRLVQYMPMVFGLRKKILQSAEIKSLSVNVVYRQEIAAGCFHYEEGSDRQLRHTPLELLDPNFQPNDEDIVAAYSVAVLNDGTVDPHVIMRSYINKVRQCSQTGALGQTVKFGDDKGKPIEAKGPWVDWFPEQCKKTAMRSHSKTLPMSGDLIDVEAQDLADTAQSVGNALGHSNEAAGPARLPTRAETSAVDHDEVTGEVYDDQDQRGDDEDKKPVRQRKGKPDQKSEEPDQSENEPHPAQKRADEIADEAGKVGNIMDLNSLRSRVKNDLAAMPDEIAAAVTEALDGAEQRIRAKAEAGS